MGSRHSDFPQATLTLAMIRRLHRDLGIPAESLINPMVERRVA
jgi:hypothetical protein